ncbi:MAG: helix-turn-helix domain-containing protein [Bacteroidia bacterium]|nr:helix-turn-helix domain-containing protein [Bacteroidia bacterium]
MRGKKLTQSEVAEKMGTSRQGLNALLNSKNIQTRSLVNLMNATGIKAYEIFEEGSASTPSKEASAIGAVEFDTSLLEEMNQMKMDIALLKKDVEFYKAQIMEKEKQLEEKERTIEILRGKE